MEDKKAIDTVIESDYHKILDQVVNIGLLCQLIESTNERNKIQEYTEQITVIATEVIDICNKLLHFD